MVTDGGVVQIEGLDNLAGKSQSGLPLHEEDSRDDSKSKPQTGVLSQVPCCRFPFTVSGGRVQFQ